MGNNHQNGLEKKTEKRKKKWKGAIWRAVDIVINALTELAAAPAMKQFKHTWRELGGEGQKNT